MVEVAPSAQGPQGAIAQACQCARSAVAKGAMRGASPGQARFGSVMCASAAHDRRPRVVRCSGGGRRSNSRCFESDGITREKRQRTFASYKERVAFVSPDAPDRAHRKSVARSVAGPCGPDVVRARPLLCRRRSTPQKSRTPRIKSAKSVNSICGGKRRAIALKRAKASHEPRACLSPR